MQKLVTLSMKDRQVLTDVLDYILGDDKERMDFIEQHGDAVFNEYGSLVLNKCSVDMTKHIFYKACYLWSELTDAENE